MLVWVILPLLGALIGWWTNHLALWMLFRPYRAISLLGLRWQGLIPRRREQLAETLAGALGEHLLTAEDRRGLLEAVEIEEHLDRIVTQVLQKQIPKGKLQFIPAFHGLREKLIEVLRNHILRQLPKKMSEMDESILARLVADLDVIGHVRGRLEAMSLAELEQLLRRVARREFVAIELAGAGIGFGIGLLQAACIDLLRRAGLMF